MVVRKTAKIDNSVRYVYLFVPQVSSTSDKNNGTSREDRHIFMIISRSVLLRTRSVSDKSRRENQNNILCPITFFSPKIVPFEITWKNMVESYRPQMATWRMPFACWITTATDTNSEYVILNVVPPQNVDANALSMLRYNYSACLLLFASILIFRFKSNLTAMFLFCFVVLDFVPSVIFYLCCLCA